MFKNLLLLSLCIILVSCVKEPDDTDKSQASSAPKGLKTVFKSETSVTASWEEPDNLGRLENGDPATITEYIVQASRRPEYNDIEKELTTTETTIDINGLKGEGTNYYFRVIAKNTSNIPQSVPSTTYLGVVGTPLKSEAPGRPLSLRIKKGTLEGSRVSLEWREPNNTGKLKDGKISAEIISYRLQYAKSDDFKEDLVTVDVKDGEAIAEIKNLNPVTTYYAKVYARNNNEDFRKEYSTSSAILTFRTNRLTLSSPDVPTKLSEIDVSSNSITLSWVISENPGKLFDGETDAEIIGYEILYSTSSDFSSDNIISKIEKPDANTAVLGNLTPFTRYYIAIRALNNNGDEVKSKSQYSPQIPGGVITTKPEGADRAERPSEVINIMVSNITESQATISWDSPIDLGRLKDGSMANLKEYVIEYSNNNAFTDIKTETVKMNTIILTGLSPSTSYFVRIKTRSDNRVTGLDTSYGALLESGFSTLFPTPPSSPSGIIASLPDEDENEGKTTIVVSWQAPSDFGLMGNGDPAEFQKYIVQYSTNKFATPSNIESFDVVSGTMTNLTGLVSSQTYFVRVLAVNKNPDSGEGLQNTSLPSEIVEITTKNDAERPTKPESVNTDAPEVYVEGQTKRVVKWEKPLSNGKTPQGEEDTIKNYIIEFALDTESFDGENVTTITVGGSETMVTLNQLTPETIYKFRIFSVNNNDTDELSKSIDLTEYSFTTNDFREPPAIPISLNQIINATRVTISFNIPEDTGKDSAGVPTPIIGYEYKFVKASITESELEEITPKAVEVVNNTPEDIVESNLKPRTKYNLYLRLANGNRPDEAKYSSYVKYDVETTDPSIQAEPTSYEFMYEEHLYYVVNNPKTWQESVTLATSNGGYLVEINSAEEQMAIQAAITNSKFVFNSNAIDGEDMPYIWIGATDIMTENTWVWNGDNTAQTFPLGTASVDSGGESTIVTWTPGMSGGSSVYSNWLMSGDNQVQPDNLIDQTNSPNGQDYGAISIDNDYKWVDLKSDNTLPLIIEIGER